MENNIAGIPIEDLKRLAVDYIGDDSFESMQTVALRVSVANCARLSYMTLGDSPKLDYEADLKLYERLKGNGHASPFEHVAMATNDDEMYYNLKGFKSMRYQEGI